MGFFEENLERVRILKAKNRNFISRLDFFFQRRRKSIVFQSFERRIDSSERARRRSEHDRRWARPTNEFQRDASNSGFLFKTDRTRSQIFSKAKAKNEQKNFSFFSQNRTNLCEPAVHVKRRNFSPQIWNVEKFESRLNDMREIYYELQLSENKVWRRNFPFFSPFKFCFSFRNCFSNKSNKMIRFSTSKNTTVSLVSPISSSKRFSTIRNWIISFRLSTRKAR